MNLEKQLAQAQVEGTESLGITLSDELIAGDEKSDPTLKYKYVSDQCINCSARLSQWNDYFICNNCKIKLMGHNLSHFSRLRLKQSRKKKRSDPNRYNKYRAQAVLSLNKPSV
jgi:hypothetical protein